MKSDPPDIILWDELNTFRELNYIFFFPSAFEHLERKSPCKNHCQMAPEKGRKISGQKV
jgi:hypothetical protein